MAFIYVKYFTLYSTVLYGAHKGVLVAFYSVWVVMYRRVGVRLVWRIYGVCMRRYGVPVALWRIICGV